MSGIQVDLTPPPTALAHCCWALHVITHKSGSRFFHARNDTEHSGVTTITDPTFTVSSPKLLTAASWIMWIGHA